MTSSIYLIILCGKGEKRGLDPFLQQRKEQGGLSLPNIELYYPAALLEHLLQWWKPLNGTLNKKGWLHP